jgi:hypothetical protein
MTRAVAQSSHAIVDPLSTTTLLPVFHRIFLYTVRAIQLKKDRRGILPRVPVKNGFGHSIEA